MIHQLPANPQPFLLHSPSPTFAQTNKPTKQKKAHSLPLIHISESNKLKALSVFSQFSKPPGLGEKEKENKAKMAYNFRNELNAPRRFRESDNISLLTMMELAPTPIEDEDYVTYFPTQPEIQQGKTDMSSSTGSLSGSGAWGSSSSSKGIVYWRKFILPL